MLWLRSHSTISSPVIPTWPVEFTTLVMMFMPSRRTLKISWLRARRLTPSISRWTMVATSCRGRTRFAITSTIRSMPFNCLQSNPRNMASGRASKYACSAVSNRETKSSKKDVARHMRITRNVAPRRVSVAVEGTRPSKLITASNPPAAANDLISATVVALPNLETRTSATAPSALSRSSSTRCSTTAPSSALSCVMNGCSTASDSRYHALCV
mmetsp:Transcript_18626/g.59312  ORF Transcript_18626/g.59312 Transcript_18626/m.59312 type:complete len:213 (+) Transcript_18626:2786-3424(+)